MNYWITTDTHFGHDKMIEYCGRPVNFSELLINRIHQAVLPEDVFIHLGDICIGRDELWNTRLLSGMTGYKWLIRGNHDKKTNHWYLNHGWDFVADSIVLNLFGLNIALSHKPIPDSGYDINIHGHFHNSDHHRHEPELQALKTPKHKLIYMEHEYRPISLRKIVMR